MKKAEESHPIRIQRKRNKGWKMPENTIYVGRPSKWENPFKIGMRIHQENGTGYTQADHHDVVRMFRNNFDYLRMNNKYPNRVRQELKGKNLACWCPLDKECHADILLEIANS